MSNLRTAMSRADEHEEQEDRVAQMWGPEAVGRALTIENETERLDRALEVNRAMQSEADRQAREDAAAADAMEIVMRVRSRVGRSKWSTTEGRVIRQIVEALRCLQPDD